RSLRKPSSWSGASGLKTASAADPARPGRRPAEVAIDQLLGAPASLPASLWFPQSTNKTKLTRVSRRAPELPGTCHLSASDRFLFSSLARRTSEAAERLD